MAVGKVAPHVGAWIETATLPCPIMAQMSHPMWVRGLKQHLQYSDYQGVSSHPMWVRGLKQQNDHRSLKQGFVAPHVGAWIETNFTGYSGW